MPLPKRGSIAKLAAGRLAKVPGGLFLSLILAPCTDVGKAFTDNCHWLQNLRQEAEPPGFDRRQVSVCLGFAAIALGGIKQKAGE